MDLTIEMPLEENQFCDGWGFYVDIENDTNLMFKPTSTSSSKPIPIPAPPKQTPPPKNEYQYITVKQNGAPPLTLNDMIQVSNKRTYEKDNWGNWDNWNDDEDEEDMELGNRSRKNPTTSKIKKLSFHGITIISLICICLFI